MSADLFKTKLWWQLHSCGPTPAAPGWFVRGWWQRWGRDPAETRGIRCPGRTAEMGSPPRGTSPHQSRSSRNAWQECGSSCAKITSGPWALPCPVPGFAAGRSLCTTPLSPFQLRCWPAWFFLLRLCFTGGTVSETSSWLSQPVKICQLLAKISNSYALHDFIFKIKILKRSLKRKTSKVDLAGRQDQALSWEQQGLWRPPLPEALTWLPCALCVLAQPTHHRL